MEAQFDEIVAWIYDNFEIKSVGFDNGDINFSGKLHKGKLLRTLPELGDPRDALIVISDCLSDKVEKYRLCKLRPLKENRTVVELQSESVNMRFYSLNEKEIPLW
ncbi:MAG: hypothetical protein WCI55_12270 [Armatimonadota bacterium]